MHFIMTCCAHQEEAQRISRILIAERLAACINILPTRSIYRWQGEVVEEEERLLLIKTKSTQIEAVEKKLRDLHGYKLPEIVGFKADRVEENYLNWLIGETTKQKTP